MSRSTVVLVVATALFGVLNINSLIAQTYTTGRNRGRWAAHTGTTKHANDRLYGREGSEE